jgi:hypothetical protein
MDEHKNDQIDPDVLRLARAKSWQLAGKYGFRLYDAEAGGICGSFADMERWRHTMSFGFRWRD